MNIRQPGLKGRMGISLALVAAVSLGWACSEAAGAEPTSQKQQTTAPAQTDSSGGKMTFQAPEEWVSETPRSSMRVAQYRLPGAEGDDADASLVVYYFGAGQGGSVKANLDRWIGQIEQPDGSSSGEKAVIKDMIVNRLKVTLLDLTGTYRGEIRPGSGVRHNNPSARLRAAVVDSPNGPYFVKLIGPEKTVARWNKAFMKFLESFQFK